MNITCKIPTIPQVSFSARDSTTSVCPVIDVIDTETLAYQVKTMIMIVRMIVHPGKHQFKPKKNGVKAFPQEFLRIYWFGTAYYISGSAQGRDFRKIQTPLTSSKMLQFT